MNEPCKANNEIIYLVTVQLQTTLFMSTNRKSTELHPPPQFWFLHLPQNSWTNLGNIFSGDYINAKASTTCLFYGAKGSLLTGHRDRRRQPFQVHRGLLARQVPDGGGGRGQRDQAGEFQARGTDLSYSVCTDEKTIKFSSYIRKFWKEQLQSHIWLTAIIYG